jgi:hypothetical protein
MIHPAKKPRRKPAGAPRGMKRSRLRPKKRSPEEYARIYGSKERVLFVKALPCVLANENCAGTVDNHHTENGGLSRKGDYQTIVPLCDWHHAALHTVGPSLVAAFHGLDLKTTAADTERRWQNHLASNEP